MNIHSFTYLLLKYLSHTKSGYLTLNKLFCEYNKLLLTYDRIKTRLVLIINLFENIIIKMKYYV